MSKKILKNATINNQHNHAPKKSEQDKLIHFIKHKMGHTGDPKMEPVDEHNHGHG
jgi:hypothetical protein